MGRPKLYLLLVFSPNAEKEHASILEAVKHHSDGDFAEVGRQAAGVPGAKALSAEIPFAVSYVFSTTKLAREMGFGLLDRDKYLLIEVTSFHAHAGMSVASNWLHRHQAPK